MKKTRTIVALLMALSMCFVMCFAITGCGGDGEEAKEDTVTLKLSTAFGENSTAQECAKKFAELLKTATDGRYEVQIYSSDQLASGNQITGIEMVQTGATDLDLRGFCIFSTIDERCTVVNMPFIMPTYDDVDSIFFNGEGSKALDKIVEENGLVSLGWGESGYRQITNNTREITKPEDMKNIKFRIPSMPMFFDLYNVLGTNTTTISMGEVYTSLQQGVIDGQENAVDTARSYNLQDVQNYMTCWNGVYDPILFSASPKLWNSLSDADKELFSKCAKEALEYQIKLNRDETEQIWSEFEEAGCHVTHLNDDQIAAFKDATASVYDTWYDKIGADLLKAFGYTK